MNILKSPVVSFKDLLLSSSLWQRHPPPTPLHHSPPPHFPVCCYRADGGSRDKLLLATITSYSEGTLTALEKFQISSTLVVSKLDLF